RRARDAIVSLVLGDADPTFALSVYPGDKLDFSTVRNELDTLPFLSPSRVVVVDNADTFVTNHRPALERYVQKPSTAGVLVLDVKTFPETTKLAKSLPDSAKIACKAPYADKLPRWCVEWAKAKHGKKLTPEAAEHLVNLVGPAMGLLDQELDKLAVSLGKQPAIGPDDVDKLVGRSKSADVFRIMDLVGEGKPGAALRILEEVFAEGEDPMGVLARLGYQLRMLATVGRLLGEGQSLGPAMDAAKVPKWGDRRPSFERQVRHLGLRRLALLTDWLIEIDLGMKGGNPLPPRVQVERLVVKLARPREEARK
ncbi:MAG TPA: DNA polymerase III subunit delta, partial [Gemmataceae bacterium]|nr:DNA polymerase III subunit delta [Gemmataceae bacterium]